MCFKLCKTPSNSQEILVIELVFSEGNWVLGKLGQRKIFRIGMIGCGFGYKTDNLLSKRQAASSNYEPT